MRRPLALLTLLTIPVLLRAQGPAPAAPTASPSAVQTESQASAALPVRRVILYKTGVGYFEHVGNVRNEQSVTIRFTSAQLNDVLKSLTALDLGKGQITGISYNSTAPLEQRLGALRLPLGQETTTLRLLGSLRGARVEVTSGTTRVEGRLLGVEQRQRERSGTVDRVDVFTIVTDAGEFRTFELSSSVHVRVVERDLRQEIGRYLDLVGSTREQDVRSMVISTAGTGERPLFVSYVSEVPIWKSTYRLVLSDKRKPLLQGWAVVDNTIGEDWQNVELSLVAGAPQSFIQAISQPYYSRRPVVPMPPAMLSAPQTHQATLAAGVGTVRGTVRDTGGAMLPGASVRLMRGRAEVARTTTDQNGRYTLTAAPGMYELRFELSGFGAVSFSSWTLPEGASTEQDAALRVGAVTESVTLTNSPSPVSGGRLGGMVGGLPTAPPPPAPMLRDLQEQAMRDVDPMATGGALGDLFEYRIKEPITLRKNQSALVPIVNAEIEAERVSLWNRTNANGRPLRAVWISNASGLTLDGGSMTVLDGNAFAGEGLIEPLKPGERRLLSYAADLAMVVSARMEPGGGRVLRVRARDGVIVQESEERQTWTYRARNEDGTPRTLVIEHPTRDGWKLAEGQPTAESTTTAQRFKVSVGSKTEATLAVRETRAGLTEIVVGEIDDALVARLVQSGVPAAALERALKPLIDKNAQLREVRRRMQRVEEERGTIAADQARVRENMKALRGSDEEKALLQRYTRQFEQQENRLESLQQDSGRLMAENARLEAELADIMRTMSFDIPASQPAR